MQRQQRTPPRSDLWDVLGVDINDLINGYYQTKAYWPVSQHQDTLQMQLKWVWIMYNVVQRLARRRVVVEHPETSRRVRPRWEPLNATDSTRVDTFLQSEQDWVVHTYNSLRGRYAQSVAAQNRAGRLARARHARYVLAQNRRANAPPPPRRR